MAEREARRNVTEYELADGRRLHVLARGRLVNIAAADGHPVEIMDLTFAVQALCAPPHREQRRRACRRACNLSRTR